MKQDKQEHIKEIDNCIKLGTEICEMIKSYNLSEFDDRFELEESIVDTIKSKKQEINKIDTKKEELILKIIGQLYNGVLVTGELTFRKGKIYPYKRQYALGLSDVKTKIMKNLHDIKDKLTSEKLDVLEFILNKVYVNQNPTKDYWGRNNDMQTRVKVIKLPELKVFEKEERRGYNRTDDIAEKNFAIKFINGIQINDDGDIEFFYDYVKDGKNEREVIELNSETYTGLILKYDDEIKKNTKEFIENLDLEIKQSDSEMKEIQEKGQNQLALCELTKELNSMQPYNH
jgi:hypothetical protein